MEFTKLSNRLDLVASFVPAGARLLDVGSDHAYLPIALLQEGKIEAAIAGEVVEGPYQSALQNVADNGLEDKIEVRLADGLAAFEPADSISCITIAGMGGRLIADILAAGLEKLAGVSRLVLQPNNREDELRAWLVDHYFCIVDEAILEENEKFYEILVVEQGSQELTAKELRFGPYLMREQAPAFVQKWSKEVEKLAFALEQVPVENQSARASLEERIAHIKEVLHVSQ